VVLGIAMSNTPDAGSSGTKVLAYYKSHHDRSNIALLALGYAGVMAVVFFAGIGSYLRRRGSDLLATLTVIGGALLAVGLGLGAGATAALTDKTSKLSPDAAQALNQVSEDIFFVVLFAGLMLATVSMGLAMLRTKSMPKALGIVTLVVGVGAVSGIGAWFAFMATGPLVLVIAGYLYQRTGQPDEISIPDVPGQRAAEPAVEQAKTKA
jgi:hypothetical protein